MSKSKKMNQAKKNAAVQNPAPKPVAAPTPISAPAPAPAAEEKAPKWFEAYTSKVDDKFKDVDRRLKVLEDAAKKSATATTAEPKPAEGESGKKPEPTATAGQGSQTKATEPVTGAAAEATGKAKLEIGEGWVPARAYEFWDSQNGCWAGPLLDITVAKYAGGNTLSGYRWCWVWTKDAKVQRYMTAQEAFQYAPK